MTQAVILRILQSIGVILVMTVIVFIGLHAIGNPVDVLIPSDADQIERARAVEALGLDKPLWQQYFYFLQGILHGDLGRSFVSGEPALELIMKRLPATLELAISAVVLALLIGVPLGLMAGIYPKSLASRLSVGLSVLGFSVPAFWIAIMMIIVFAVNLGWLPSSGRGDTVRVLGVEWSFLTLDGLRHLLLPALSLSIYKMSLVFRLVRAGAIEISRAEYIRFARAKGLGRRRIVMVHVLKNILIPVITIVGLELGGTIAFAVVTETIFAWPGTGSLIIKSISVLDRPVIVAYLIVIALLFVTINLLTDLAYLILDPRIREKMA
ncbi:ABC transporter permease [Xinfangfangia pollutisoli]|uniref:ABC transporter permease n=1 Tax=Xinfangfangia pollutisoli TaxID=2865960 RepID=UPI001CD4E4A1|nr:ABC transporter permease [Xinfangfangia pollutisoli]